MNKQSFMAFLENIAQNELSEIQLEQFKMESVEILDIMFISETVDELRINGRSNGLDLGLSAEIMSDISKTTLDFVSLIISSFTLYLEYRRFKKEELDDKLKEAEELWKKILKEEKIKPEVAEKIAKKYSKEFIKTMK